MSTLIMTNYHLFLCGIGKSTFLIECMFITLIKSIAYYPFNLLYELSILLALLIILPILSIDNPPEDTERNIF